MALHDTGPPDLGCGVGRGCSVVAPALAEEFMLLGLFRAEVYPYPIASQNGTVFRERTFKEVIKVK